MNKRSVILAIFLLLIGTAAAQLDWAVTDLKCGNGQLDEFEMCEEDVEQNRCLILEELLEVDTACYEAHCTCLPRVNMAFCGNDKREGVELCDGTADDFCPELGKRMNLTLECNSKCGCDIIDVVPDDYDPGFIEKLENKTEEKPVCGDKKVSGGEDCDPEGVLCTTNLGEPGKCTSECKCEKLEAKNITAYENKTADNITANKTENRTENKTEQNITGEKPEKKPGFFTKFWNWIVSLFS